MSLVERGNTFVERAYKCRDRIADLALEFIQDGSTILVHSLSKVVTILLLRAAAANRRFRVYVTESKPTSQGFEAVRILQQHGILASVILDSAVGFYIGSSDIVLVGAEGVVENGGVVNQVQLNSAITCRFTFIDWYLYGCCHGQGCQYSLLRCRRESQICPFLPLKST